MGNSGLHMIAADTRALEQLLVPLVDDASAAPC